MNCVATTIKISLGRVYKSLENGLAFWLDAELEGPEGGGLRRRILEAKSRYHDAMFSFALKYLSEASARLAADVILRWKKRPLQDEAYLVNLMRDADDPNIVAAAKTVHERSAALAAAALAPKPAPEVVESLKQSLEAAEADLRQRSESYRRYVQAKRAPPPKLCRRPCQQTVPTSNTAFSTPSILTRTPLASCICSLSC
jgi:hypothetical protein